MIDPNDIIIEAGIPMLEETYRGDPLPAIPRGFQFPWARMSVGTSFFVPCPHGLDIIRLQNRISGSANTYFGAGCVVTRCRKEGGVFGVRAWLQNAPWIDGQGELNV